MLAVYIIGGLLVAFLVAARFTKKEFTVAREIKVTQKSEEVFGYIKFLKNHYHFSKWVTKDPGKLQPSVGLDGTKGFMQPWNNYKEKAGIGELHIREIYEGAGIELLHRYFKPVKGLAVSKINVRQNTESGSTVRWEYTGITSYPLNLLTAMLNMEKIIGPELDQCLKKLSHALHDSGKNKSPQYSMSDAI